VGHFSLLDHRLDSVVALGVELAAVGRILGNHRRSSNCWGCLVDSEEEASAEVENGASKMKEIHMNFFPVVLRFCDDI
jgi:hypothetical protein